jgi:hypothetical protein
MTRKWGMHLSTSVFPTVKDNWLRRLAKSRTGIRAERSNCDLGIRN